MYYVYILRSRRDGNFYIGYTSQLNRRIQQHNNGEVVSTKYRRPMEIIYYEAYRSIKDAQKREKN